MACECSLTLGDDVIDVGDLAFITACVEPPTTVHRVLLSGRKPLLTFSSSKRWNRRTWIAWTIWKWKKWKQLANVWRLLRFFCTYILGYVMCVSFIYSILYAISIKKILNHIVQVFFLRLLTKVVLIIWQQPLSIKRPNHKKQQKTCT